MKDRIALMSGLTVPEAHEAGLFPDEVIAVIRKVDPLKRPDAMNGLLEEGASTLFGPLRPRLLLATQEEAEAGVKRLMERFSGSEKVWIVNREIMAEDDGGVNEAVESAEQ